VSTASCVIAGAGDVFGGGVGVGGGAQFDGGWLVGGGTDDCVDLELELDLE
jgi:hypothetical protein